MFWRDEARAFWDPCAPSLSERIEGIRALWAAGIPVVLRIDPLFPRSPLPIQPDQLTDFGLVEAQTLEDLENLVSFARELGARHVAYSPVKIVLARLGGSLPTAVQNLLKVYRALSAPEEPIWRGGSWRLPHKVAEPSVTGPFLEICRRQGVPAKFCMQNLLETN